MTKVREHVLRLITPELPPRMGGVADYAVRLAAHWPGGPKVEAWVAPGAAEAAAVLPEWTVWTFGAGETLPSRGAVLVNYTQYGFGAFGVPWRIVQTLRQWRRAAEARRLAVYFHETWLSGPLWRRRGIVAPAARACARALARAADVVMTNCDLHAAQLDVGRSIEVLPVPSNIPCLVPREAREAGGPLRVVIFGLPETRLRTLEAHAAFLRWIGERGALGELVLLGAGSENDRFALAGARLARSLAGERVRRVGASEPVAVSAELAGADLGLSAYAAEEVGKSGTLAALFTHGCPVGCAGHDAGGLAFDMAMTGGVPRDWRAWEDREARQVCARRVDRYAAEALDWTRHAEQVAALLVVHERG